LAQYVLAGAIGPASAQIALDGHLLARQACPALQSIRRGTNPGDMRIEVGKAYDLIGKNRDDASHYQIRIEEAPAPRERWVAAACGEHVAAAGAPGGEPRRSATDAGGGRPAPATAAAYVLAASWQPAFCETRPQKPECRSQSADRFDAARFSLHGLWPQPRGNAYCGVAARDIELDESGDWHLLPPLALSPQTRADLDEVMPGTQSFLHRHEWIKHGTCYADTPEEYFRESLALMAALNASPLRDLLAGSLGGTVPITAIRDAFDAGFDADVGDRIRLDCVRDAGRTLLIEIRISLRGDIDENTPFDDLLRTADRVPLAGDCPDTVMIDPAGLQ
jgi:ribonuclease T2